MKSAPRIAVIGAGMAGAAAARLLADSGASVAIFDKSRGLGGRMATRRIEGGAFDHGAQYFRAQGARFAARLAEWREAGLVEEWEQGRFVGAPAMNAPVKALIGDIPVHGGVAVAGVEKDGVGWRLRGEGGDDEVFDAVLSAIPSPQAAPILASGGWEPSGLAGERYAPCLAAMLAFDTPIEIDPFLTVEDETIAWIADNGSKPGREGALECVVVHAGADWSRAHLEEEPDEILAMLFMRFAGLTGVMAEPVHGAAHRWRYAFVDNPLGETHLWNAQRRLGACGDWCLAPRVEAAFDSGEAAARAMFASL
ncbi:MAG: FAD-dependent oxidoreductase [Salinarimonadaceae bacterium]|nr:MAG: FAD-dependent oxidoreductase [Salinarimonadaceae bacterium]